MKNKTFFSNLFLESPIISITNESHGFLVKEVFDVEVPFKGRKYVFWIKKDWTLRDPRLIAATIGWLGGAITAGVLNCRGISPFNKDNLPPVVMVGGAVGALAFGSLAYGIDYLISRS